jgi:hypothetical protein
MGFQIGFPALKNYPPSGVTYDPDVQTWMDARAAVGDAVPTAYANAVNQYVLDLKAISGHWDTITQLVVFAGATTANGGQKPIKGEELIQFNFVNGDFDPKTGVKGNATNKYFATQYDNTSFGGSDMHTYALLTELPTVNTMRIYGNGATSNGAWSISINTGTGNSAARCRNTTGDSAAHGSGGGFGLSRSVSGSYARMFGDNVATVTRSAQSTNASPYYLLASSSNASTTPSGWADARVLVWAIGPASTLANYTTPGNDLQTALNAI